MFHISDISLLYCDFLARFDIELVSKSPQRDQNKPLSDTLCRDENKGSIYTRPPYTPQPLLLPHAHKHTLQKRYLKEHDVITLKRLYIYR